MVRPPRLSLIVSAHHFMTKQENNIFHSLCEGRESAAARIAELDRINTALESRNRELEQLLAKAQARIAELEKLLPPQ